MSTVYIKYVQILKSYLILSPPSWGVKLAHNSNSIVSSPLDNIENLVPPTSRIYTPQIIYRGSKSRFAVVHMENTITNKSRYKNKLCVLCTHNCNKLTFAPPCVWKESPKFNSIMCPVITIAKLISLFWPRQVAERIRTVAAWSPQPLIFIEVYRETWCTLCKLHKFTNCKIPKSTLSRISRSVAHWRINTPSRPSRQWCSRATVNLGENMGLFVSLSGFHLPFGTWG